MLSVAAFVGRLGVPRGHYASVFSGPRWNADTAHASACCIAQGHGCSNYGVQSGQANIRQLRADTWHAFERKGCAGQMVPMLQ